MFKSSWVVGAAAVVTAPDGRIMLVRHSYKVGWYTPGGFLNRREQAADAVVREVREEVGLPIVVVGEPAVLLRTNERVVEIMRQRHEQTHRKLDAESEWKQTLRQLHAFFKDS